MIMVDIMNSILVNVCRITETEEAMVVSSKYDEMIGLLDK